MKRVRKLVRDLFTASEVAALCQVDLKTIHNWAERGEIRHFRTPGRHLRFRKDDVRDFLERFGYPIPEELSEGKPSVFLLGDNQESLSETGNLLSEGFSVRMFAEAVDGLLAIGASVPDVVVMEDQVSGLEAWRITARLRACEQTKNIRPVIYSKRNETRDQSLQSGASAHVSSGNRSKLQETLRDLTANK